MDLQIELGILELAYLTAVTQFSTNIISRTFPSMSIAKTAYLLSVLLIVQSQTPHSLDILIC